jgi:hypothetical protein
MIIEANERESTEMQRDSNISIQHVIENTEQI